MNVYCISKNMSLSLKNSFCKFRINLSCLIIFRQCEILKSRMDAQQGNKIFVGNIAEVRALHCIYIFIQIEHISYCVAVLFVIPLIQLVVRLLLLGALYLIRCANIFTFIHMKLLYDLPLLTYSVLQLNHCPYVQLNFPYILLVITYLVLNVVIGREV